ncbi:uncharacterized protein LOC135681154 isoform X1 [Rhopilema esculentum]|uniref:uncharacterized protein LOC135681154 isoform X1 n=1 Tax=Rhopilema esculentum TaxID=499914 RepID=UPI0031D33B2B
MDDIHLQVARRASSTSHRTTMSDSSVRKPASIYEINELYSALKDLAQSSPAQGHRRQRTPSANFDSSDSWTSGTDSPDVRSKMGNEKKIMKVIRSSSNIAQRFPVLESPRTRVRSAGTKPSILPNKREAVTANNVELSPKLILRKSKSDASRLRSRSSVDGSKSMAEKIRDQRLKFTQGLRKKEIEEERECIDFDKEIQNINDLLEWAKMDEPKPAQEQKKRRKKPGQRKRVGSLIESTCRIRPNFSDSNLRYSDVTSRIDRWYERASAVALGEIKDECEIYESFSSSESDDSPKESSPIKKGKSLDGIDLELDSFTADDLLSKWMQQKKSSLIAEDRGRSSSDASVEPRSLDSSVLSIGKDDGSPERANSVSPLVVNRIIVSQPSVDDQTQGNGESPVDILPNQPIFYIPNFTDHMKSNTTIISEDVASGNALLSPARPRSRSAISMGETFDRRDEAAWKQIQKMSEKRSKSFGTVNRRGSMDAAMKQDVQERLLRTTSDYRRKSPRPRSLTLGKDNNEKTPSNERHENLYLDEKDFGHTDNNANIFNTDKKRDKGRKFSKFPGKLKTLLSGKKT